MKKDKMKLAGLLLAIACVSCGAGGVIASNNAVSATSVTASAEATNYTMSSVAALNASTASVLQLYATVEAEKPAVSSWDHTFAFVETE